MSNNTFIVKELLNDLKSRTLHHKSIVTGWLKVPAAHLNQKNCPESWSILECIEHLNRYANFYLPEIQQQLSKNPKGGTLEFKSGLLGNHFAKAMLPKERLNKMKTFKHKNPVGSNLDISTLELFLQQQDTLLVLLNKAEMYNLSKIKTATTLSKWIRIRLGDTFRVVIYHNERHVLQAQKIIKLMNRNL